MDAVIPALVAFVSAVGCAAKLQPRVWLPLKGVDSVDFFWWTESQVCNLRVLWLEPNGTYKEQTFEVPADVCLEKLKGLGFAVPKPAPPSPAEGEPQNG